jgi:predicted exporter
MNEEFGETGTTQNIRVMFDDLPTGEAAGIKAGLAALPNASGVDYEAGSADYNKDNHTLFVVHTSFAYASAEEKALENAISSQFADYNMVLRNDDSTPPGIPTWVLALAVLVVLVILLVMCASWAEPFLFLFTIGCAVIINFGSNIILGEISNITFTTAAALQIVLSMDYSIILMNRYRQELSQTDDKPLAMRRAMKNAFVSILSSAFTTIVGLLILLLMRFKIGFDMGIVLAKGVFFSLLCVFTILPALILIFSRLLERSTKKRQLHIPTKKLSSGIFRLRWVLAGLFVALFITATFLQGHTKTAYSYAQNDPIAEVFVPENTMVLLYDNLDDPEVTALAAELEEKPEVKSAISYSTTIGKQYSPEELTSFIKSMGLELKLDSSMLGILYYDYYHKGEEAPAMSAGEFIRFVADELAPNPSFSAYISQELKAQLEQLRRFGSKASLTAPLDAAGLAEFFGMDESEAKQLLLYYYTKNGGGGSVKMSLPTLAGFLKDEVAADAEYSAMLDGEMLARLEQLKVLTDKERVTAQIGYGEMGELLGVDAEMARLMYVFAYSQNAEYEPPELSLPDFVTLIRNDIVDNPSFSQYIDSSMLAQLNAAALILNNPLGEILLGAKRGYSETATLLGLEPSLVKMLYTYGAAKTDADSWRLSLRSVLDSLAAGSEQLGELMGGTQDLEQLLTARKIVNATLSGSSYSSEDMAALLGMDKSDMRGLYLLYTLRHGDTSGWKISAQDFVNFVASSVLTDPSMSSRFSESDAAQLKNAARLIDTVVAETPLTAEQIGSLLRGFGTDFEQAMAELVYLYHASIYNGDPNATLSVQALFDSLSGGLLDDPRFTGLIDEKMRADISGYKAQLEDGVKQLRGQNYSRLILTTTLPLESDETTSFLSELTSKLKTGLTGRYYLIGSSAMNFEIEGDFDRELLTISVLTALAIFLIVLISFRSFFVPLVLVLIVQCGVFITVSVIGLQGFSIYYLVLLIVQAILMGATIDYGILFTNYYRESRRSHGVRESIAMAYEGSMHTILTSGLLMVLAMGSLGYCFDDPVSGQICRTLAMGVLSSVLLILFILPALLAVFDRFTAGKHRLREAKKPRRKQSR